MDMRPSCGFLWQNNKFFVSAEKTEIIYVLLFFWVDWICLFLFAVCDCVALIFWGLRGNVSERVCSTRADFSFLVFSWLELDLVLDASPLLGVCGFASFLSFLELNFPSFVLTAVRNDCFEVRLCVTSVFVFGICFNILVVMVFLLVLFLLLLLSWVCDTFDFMDEVVNFEY